MTDPLSNSGIPQTEVQILAGFYADAAERVRKVVLFPTGMKQSAKEFRQARAAMLSHQIDQITAQLNQRSSKWVGTFIHQAYFDGLKRGVQQAKDAGVKEKGALLTGSFSVINERAVKVLAADTYADLSRASDGMGAQAKSVLRQTAQIGLGEADINRILAGGIITGEPVQTIRALRAELERVHGKTVVVVNKNGDPMHFEARYYAEMVSRTKTREAVEHARHERLSELDIDLVSVIGRVSKSFCTAYLGMVFSLSGRSRKYPALSSLPSHGPPFHPNCSKSTRPFIEELATEKQLKNSDGVDGADQLIGVDAQTAQRRYQDLQIHQQVRERFPANKRPEKVQSAK